MFNRLNTAGTRPHPAYISVQPGDRMMSLLIGFFGVLLMLFAFFAEGVRGALSSGPLLPMSKAGRVIFFLAGVTLFAKAIWMRLG